MVWAMPLDAEGGEVWGKRSKILQCFRKNNLILVYFGKNYCFLTGHGNEHCLQNHDLLSAQIVHVGSG